MADTFHAKFGPLVAINFTTANLDTNVTNGDFIRGAQASNTLWTAPVAGSVVGMSINANGNISAGAAVVKAHVASTEFTQNEAISLTLNATNSNASYGSVRAGVMTFTAGQRLGISATSDATLAATTLDFDATLIVQLNPD